MQNKSLILIVVIVLIVIVATTLGFFYVKSGYKNPITIATKGIVDNTAKVKAVPTLQQQSAQIKKDYPQTISGIINFLDTKNTHKTTIKTSDGKEYTLWPLQPTSIYESLGVKNGQKVEIQGKLNSQGNLEWATIKPI